MIKMTVVEDNLDKLPDAIRKQVMLVVSKAAFDVQAHAQANVPVDTGAAKASIHVVLPDKSGYEDAVLEAQAAHEEKYPNDKPMEFFDEDFIDQEDLLAYVAVAVLYGAPLEYGTSTMLARPFMRPAVAAVETAFFAAMAQAIAKGAQDAGT